MTPLFAHAIPTLEQPFRGIHLFWNGPHPLLFAPGGWEVERRPAAGQTSSQDATCDEVSAARLARLRDRLELRLVLGWMRLSTGAWPGPEPGLCEVFTLDLDRPASGVSGVYRGRHGLAIAVNNGKAVGYQFLLFALDGRPFDFGAAPVEQVIVYGLRANAVRVCLAPPPRWRDATVIARLHLPLREFVPSLDSDAKELAEAQARLAPGEAIDPVRFAQLADLLRVALQGPGRRPIDRLLRMQADSEEPEEMAALDPLRTLVASPKWRRVLGFGFIDRDPGLVPGASFDYRVTGRFPAAELDARVFGFHTIPPGTALPADFSLGDCRFRLPNPVTTQAAPGIPPAGSQWVTRCGIPLAPRNDLPWFGFGIDDFSASIDLPTPVTRLILELEPGHELVFVAGLPGGATSAAGTVPPGSQPRLDFPVPVTRLNLAGKGFLFAVRIPADENEQLVPVSTVLLGVTFAETPRPPEPLDVEISNLQRPAGPSLSTSQASVPALHTPGIDVRWRPAPAAGAPLWPSGLSVPPPLDATTFEVERRIEPADPFEPVLPGDDNTMFGSGDEPAPERSIRPGVDLMQLYPEAPHARRGSDRFAYTDVFRAPDEANPARRDPPPPGTLLRYRVRTIDAIGRPSAAWRESDPLRLEKHEPPPLPAAFDPTPADELPGPAPTGVYARVLVRGAADLTPAETALLGSSDNAILLRWGWHAAQRGHDPFATGFRVYLSRTFDVLPGEVLAVEEVPGSPGDWRVELRVSPPIAANAAAGLSLDAGYPFFIVEHAAGATVTMLVRTRIPDASGAFRKPALGPVSVPLKLSPAMTRPKTWSERVVFPDGHASIPITAAEQYEAVIRDRLLLSAEHPRDALWVGIASADSEPYVADTFPNPGPDGPLPGNESAVVSVLCDARRAFRPEFSPPPPAGPVPRILAPEPAGAAVSFRLDLAAQLAATDLAPGQLSQPERTTVTALFAALRVAGNGLVAVDPGDAPGPDRPLALPNPGDQASVLAAVQAGASAALEDRLAVGLVALHPYADRLFRAATPTPVPFGPFDETLPPTEERYLYRFRRADSLQRLSVAAAVANAVVRVPSPEPGPSPRRAPSEPGDPARLRLQVPPDPRLAHLIVFEHPPGEGAPGEAELLRVANRPELEPGTTVRLRTSDGAVLAPAVTPLEPAAAGPDGWLLPVDVTGPPGGAVNVWASTLTEDGIPSPPGGPWRVTLAKPALAAPDLSVSSAPDALDFDWTLPDPLITFTWLEVSTDGIAWEPASGQRRSPAASARVAAGPAPRHFRVVAGSQDGRRAVSNAVIA